MGKTYRVRDLRAMKAQEEEVNSPVSLGKQFAEVLQKLAQATRDLSLGLTTVGEVSSLRIEAVRLEEQLRDERAMDPVLAAQHRWVRSASKTATERELTRIAEVAKANKAARRGATGLNPNLTMKANKKSHQGSRRSR